MAITLRYTTTTTGGKSTGLTYEELNQNFKEFMNLTAVGSGQYTLNGLSVNAASATVLQTARTINGVSFDGSANINIPAGNVDSQITSLGVGTPASGTVGEIRATNNITAYYSDERLKDFHGTIPDALNKVLQLNGYYFTENQTAKDLGYSNDNMQVGLSAQEVEQVLPEVVTDAPITNDQNYRTIWYDKLIPLLIEAIKEQQQQINKLKMLLEKN